MNEPVTANQTAELILSELERLRVGTRRIPLLFDHLKRRAAEGDATAPDLMDRVIEAFESFYIELGHMTAEKKTP